MNAIKRIGRSMLPQPVLSAIRSARTARAKSAFKSLATSRIAEYLQSTSEPKLQIGCGPYPFDGWLNVDIVCHHETAVYMDCTQPLPLPSSSFTRVFTEHLIEHIDYESGLAMLRECFRILKPDGMIRIATPDIRFLVGLYGAEKTEVQSRYLAWALERWAGTGKSSPAFVLNNFFHAWGHQFIYDPDALSAALRDAGFGHIQSRSPGESENVELRGLERHGIAITDEFNQLETMVLEATKTESTRASI